MKIVLTKEETDKLIDQDSETPRSVFIPLIDGKPQK